MPVDRPNQGSLPVRTRTPHRIPIRAHEAREARPDFCDRRPVLRRLPRFHSPITRPFVL